MNRIQNKFIYTMIITTFCLVILSTIINAEKLKVNQPVYVDIETQATVDSLHAGSKGQLSITFKTRKGVKLNKLPPLRIFVEQPTNITLDKKEVNLPSKKELDKLEDLFLELIMDPDADMSVFYFPELKPFIFPFKITGNIPSTLVFKVKVNYTYCTTKDGFCVPKDVVLEIPLAVDKKKATGK